jgi:hypothetical protein
VKNVGIGTAVKKSSQSMVPSMARKLYIFTPALRIRSDGQQPAKWAGGFTANYTYLGDYQARLLGVGNQLVINRPPQWLRGPASGAKNFRGGASRSDKGFRGWG